MSCKKVRFVDEATAEAYIKKLNSGGSRRSVVPVRAYLCPECMVWHITSRRYHEDIEFEKLEGLVMDLRRKVKEQNRVVNELNHKIKEQKGIIKELRRELGVWDDLKDL